MTSTIQKIGIVLFCIALAIFTFALSADQYQLTDASLRADNPYHKKVLLETAKQTGVLDKTYDSKFNFIKDYKMVFGNAQATQNTLQVPEGINEWDFKLGDWKQKDYLFYTVKHSGVGLLSNNLWWFFIGSFVLGIIGILVYIIPIFKTIEGIKHDGIFLNSMTRGLTSPFKFLIFTTTLVSILAYGIIYMGGNVWWSLISGTVILLIISLVFFVEKQFKIKPSRSAAPIANGWLGMITGAYLVGFYILLYWKPEFITNWVQLVDPISKMLSGNEASQWFLYGCLYTIIVFVMGMRMIAKYRHNRYQIIRTLSVIFFQTCFAFILPEILVKFNQPWYDFKNIWPLNYSFFLIGI